MSLRYLGREAFDASRYLIPRAKISRSLRMTKRYRNKTKRRSDRNFRGTRGGVSYLQGLRGETIKVGQEVPS